MSKETDSRRRGSHSSDANFIVDRVAGIAKCVQPVPQLVVPTTTNDRHDIDSVEHLPKPVRAYGEHEEPTEVA